MTQEQQVNPSDPSTFRSGTITNKQIVKEVPIPALFEALKKIFPEAAKEDDIPLSLQIGTLTLPLETDVRISLVYRSVEGDTITSPAPPMSPSQPIGEITYPKTQGRTMLPPTMQVHSTPHLPPGVESINDLVREDLAAAGGQVPDKGGAS